MIDQTKLQEISTRVIAAGGHADLSAGMCVMEAVSYVAGEPWSDHPQCASPVIASFLRSWNDVLPDDERQMLKPLIPMLVGTRGSAALEDRRAWMLTDWLVRECAPAWLDCAGLTEQAAVLRAMHELDNSGKVQPILPALQAIRSDAAAAWAAAWAAAGDAAGAAAWAAAWAAARAAAWAAARAAAGAAAGDAARAAAWAAAGDAATKKLAPTKAALQQSALMLVRRMCEMQEGK